MDRGRDIDPSPAVLAVVSVGESVKVVPQSERRVVERFGRYTRTLEAGLSLIVPWLDRVAKRVSVLERQPPAFSISVVTRDNVELGVESTVFFRPASQHPDPGLPARRGAIVPVRQLLTLFTNTRRRR